MLSTLVLPLLMGMQGQQIDALSRRPADIATLLVPATYSNAERVYFEREAGRVPPPLISFRIEQHGSALAIVNVDEFGVPTGPELPMSISGNTVTIGACTRTYQIDGNIWNTRGNSGDCPLSNRFPSMIATTGVSVAYGDGRVSFVSRARPFTCWVSVRRDTDRANGQADWSFDRGLAIHDQGGRVLVQPEGAPPVVIRMRNVVWPPPSTNRPSLVLYVHRPESPDRAESYSWADPDARMVGINLRWMQASCSQV